MLASAGFLKDGRLVDSDRSLSADDRKQLSNTIDYLSARGQLYALRPFFAGTRNDPFATSTTTATAPRRGQNWQLAQALKTRLGLEPINRDGQLVLNYHSQGASVVRPQPGHVLIGPLNFYATAKGKPSIQTIPGPDGAWTLTMKQGDLVVEEPGGANQAVFDLTELVTGNGPLANQKPFDATSPRPALLLRSTRGTLTAAFAITHVNVTNVGAPDVVINSVSGWMQVTQSTSP